MLWSFSFLFSIYFIFSVWKSRRGNLRGSAATSSLLAHPPSSNSCRLILTDFCRILLISADFLNTWYVRQVGTAISIYSQYIGINDGNLKIDSINERAHIWIFSKCQMFLTSINDKYNTKYWNDFNFPWEAITKIYLSVDDVPTSLLWPPSQQSKKKIFHFLVVASFEILRS